jgi:hypothetical protein
MLRKILRGRMVITPGERDGVRGLHFQGEGNVQRMLTGWLPEFPHCGGVPNGNRTLVDARNPRRS